MPICAPVLFHIFCHGPSCNESCSKHNLSFSCLRMMKLGATSMAVKCLRHFVFYSTAGIPFPSKWNHRQGHMK